MGYVNSFTNMKVRNTILSFTESLDLHQIKKIGFQKFYDITTRKKSQVATIINRAHLKNLDKMAKLQAEEK